MAEKSRVQCCQPQRMAVMVDGVHEIAVLPSSLAWDRWDAVVELNNPARLMIVVGLRVGGKPKVPDGARLLAWVHVPHVTVAIGNHNIEVVDRPGWKADWDA